MASTLHDKLCAALHSRSGWETRNRLWYEMRHDGRPRARKPFKGAADLHMPIADNAVEKLKPFYINSVFSRQQLASFTPLLAEQGEASADAAQCLDWKLRKESNYPMAYAQIVDLMLTYSGKVTMKLRWDAKARGGKGKLAFEAVDPLMFIPQKGGDCIDEMDYFAHVKQLTVAQYQREKVYNQDPSLLARIRGGDTQREHWKAQEKASQEGITWSANDEEIILWETYERVGEGWRVKTYSPSAPDEVVRDTFILGWEWQGEPMQPFTEFFIEIGEKGFYAPRGVVEKVAAFETYATKLWNQQADWLEYAAKPLFTRDKDAALINAANITMGTGQVLPPGVMPAQMPAPPFKLEEEIQKARQLAEESAQVPDFGAQNADQQGKQDTRTATEWNYIGSFASQGIQYKSWVSSLSEGQVYRKAWALLLRFGGEELESFAAKERKVLPATARHDNYLIEPDAQPDAWNKKERVQRSFARFQLLRGDPRIDQDALYTDFLSSDDPRLVKKLYVPSKQKAANEAEDEAMEIAILMEGFPAQALPGENHQLRIQMLMGKLQQLSMMPPPETPAEMGAAQLARQRLHEHVAMHVQLMQQENPQGAKQIVSALETVDPAQAAGPAPGAGGGPMAMPPGGPDAAGTEAMGVAV